MLRDLTGRVGQVHDPGRSGVVLAAEEAVAEAEVERGADDDDEVGAVEGLAARLGHEQRVATGDDPAAHAVGDGRQAGVLDQVEGGVLGAVGPDVGAEDEHRAGGGREQPGHGRDGVGVGVGAARRTDDRHDTGALVEELVHRHVHEHRTAVRRPGRGEGLVHARGHLGGGRDGARQLGDRRDDRRLVELLQRAAAPAVLRGATTDHDHRRPGELRLGDGADPVGHARARRSARPAPDGGSACRSPRPRTPRSARAGRRAAASGARP